MENKTWTDEEMKERLELLGYDLNDDYGNFSLSILVEVASLMEKHKWDDIQEVWI